MNEINGDKLKQYVRSSKSVTFTSDGGRMPGKYGSVLFDLSEFYNAEVLIHAKRMSGNGKTIISSGTNEKNVVIASKVYQTFDIISNGEIRISRPSDSTGEVVIVGITIIGSKIGDSEVSNNWKNILNKCGKYNCLRLIKENGFSRLFASTGGFIERGDLIKIIETNPPNAVSRNGDRVVFNSSCEITNLVLGQHVPSIIESKEIFPNRQPPTAINIPEPDKPKEKIKIPGGNAIMLQSKYEYQLPNLDEHIVYDSFSLKNFNNFIAVKDKVKHIRSNNNNFLVIKYGGSTRASLSALRDSANYIVMMNGKKLGGNGRVFVSASIDQNQSGGAQEIVFDGNFSNKYIEIKTGPGAPNSVQKLHLTMPEKFCNGEVLIQRILIVDNFGIENARSRIEGPRYLPPSTPSNLEIPTATYNVDFSRDDDSVYVSAKKFALYSHLHPNSRIDSDIRGTIMSNDISGLVWATRVESIIDGIRIGDLKNESTNDSLLISHVGALRASKNIWIQPFEYGCHINDFDSNCIKNAKRIMSPSLSCVQYLQEKFPESRVEQMHLPLPWVTPQKDDIFANLEFVLTFERDPKTLSQLFKVWDNSFPTLVVVGARGKYPDNVIPLNEYYPYDKLMFLLQKCLCIVDLPCNNEYRSSILSLAHHLGKTIISTNWFIVDKPNGIFIAKIDKDGTKITSDEALISGIKSGLSMARPTNDMSKYNDEVFKTQLHSLFS